MTDASAGGVSRHHPSVLMVDDNPDMRMLMRSILQEFTEVIYECEDGPSALEAYSLLHPDWVLMDIELDGIDGIAITRALRLIDAGARIVMVTGHGDQAYRHAAAEAGACGFVLKENLLELPVLLAASTPLDPEPGPA